MAAARAAAERPDQHQTAGGRTMRERSNDARPRRRAVATVAALAVSLAATAVLLAGGQARAQPAAGAGAPPGAAQSAAADHDPDAELGAATIALVFGPPDARRQALESIRAYGQPDIMASLILAMRYVRADAETLDGIAAEITGDAGGRKGWFDWMLWQEAHSEVVPHASYARLKTLLLAQLDPNFLRFLQPEHLARERMRIRLEEIVWGGVSVDGIPSLDDPELIAADAADYLEASDLVFGVEINGDARAYPLRVMGWHEMFNETIGGVPVALAYCTLCGAGILFETTVEGIDERFVFGSSGLLYRSNKLMFDRQTDSLWNQFTGEPVVGPLAAAGIRLRQRPVVITSWEKWRAAHPDTRVLSLDTGHRRDYGSGVVYRDYFASDELMFPALADKGRLQPKDYVFGVRMPLAAKAWPIVSFAGDGGKVINDTIGATPLVLIGDAATRTVRAYQRGDLRFAAGPTPATLAAADGSSWRIEEHALVAADGRQLPRVAGHIAYWFAWDGYLGVRSELYDGGG